MRALGARDESSILSIPTILMAYVNVEDKRANERKWYRRNRSAIIARRLVRKRKITKLVRDAKNKPCVDCGHSFPAVCMDFDHVRGDKLFSLAEARILGASVQRVKQEIKKCDLVCSNCHRIRTFKRILFPGRLKW